MNRSLPVLVLLGLVTASCGKSSTGVRVTQVTVNPLTASLTTVGETAQFTATATGGGGNPIAGLSVAWSTSDSTVATVSATGVATARGAGAAIITATVSGVSGTAGVTVTLPAQLGECTDTTSVSLNPGQFMSLGSAGTSACFMLPSGNSGDRYRVVVLDPSTSEASDTTHVTLQVSGQGVTAAPPPQAAINAARVLPALSAQEAATLQRSVRIEQATERAHLALRASERQMIDYLRARDRLHLLPAHPALARVAAAAAATSPAKRTFDTSTDPQCNTSASMKKTGILIYENNDLVFYQDSTQNASNPVSVANVQEMASYFTDYAKGMIRSYFGAIPDIDGNGKEIVFISPIVGSGEAAFVWSGDLLSTTDCAASNQGEIVYFSNSLIGAMSGAQPSYQALGTLAHETKHVVSLYNRIAASVRANAKEFEPGWAEEGIAEISGEMSSRIAWAANGGPPVNAEVTRSDLATSSGGISVTPYDYAVLLRMVRTIDYLSSQPNSLTSTPLGADSASNVYGSGWHFHRWIGDAFGNAASGPMADSSIFRQLVDSLTPAEPAGLTTVTGETFQQLLEEYAAAVSLNGTGAPQPTRAFTSYDFVSTTGNLLQVQPPGLYPWVVTPQGTGFQSASFAGPVGNSGMRIHDFVSNGTGTGALIQVAMSGPSDVVVVRLN